MIVKAACYVWSLQAEEVLERFLKEKSVESNSILQADQKLTDSEKRIHGKTFAAEFGATTRKFLNQTKV